MELSIKILTLTLIMFFTNNNIANAFIIKGNTTETTKSESKNNNIVVERLEIFKAYYFNFKKALKKGGTQQNAKTNTLAILAPCLAILGLFILGIPCSIAAIILGIVALTQIKAKNEKGSGLAICGIILGAIVLILTLSFLASL
jgi:hypothetical protein